jgi:hypothetical protein
MAVPNAAAHFKPMQQVPSFKQLLSYGREVDGGFAKSAKATVDSCRLTPLPGRIKNKRKN